LHQVGDLFELNVKLRCQTGNFLVTDDVAGANYTRPKKNGRWLQAVAWERLVMA